MSASSLFSAMRRMSKRGLFRKRIGTGSGCARCCFSPLAEHLMLQKYLDLQPSLFRISQHEREPTTDK
jgi:hypothetical protein